MPCYINRGSEDETWFLCGDLGPKCGGDSCAAVPDFLCDFPVGKQGRTCDRLLCDSHATEVAPGIHYCPGHLALWNEFRAAGGVKRVLENVTPFRKPKR